MFSPVAVSLFVTTLVELFVAVRVAGFIGLLPTATLLVLLSVSGAIILRSRGAGFVRSTIANVSAGQSLVPEKLADQALVLLACLLLVVPGFFTAALALLMFVPPIRALARPVVRSRVQKWTRPYKRYGRSFVDVDSVVSDDGVVDVDLAPNNAYPPPQSELG